ncbi:MAG: hypothetical protein SWK76_07575 [Actinomycetota bacterium]|nr:hypothetical protein [Actinomycetota bacterium]
MRGLLVFLGWILILVALAVLILGLVDVAQGEKGTWGIWPIYLIHGGVAFAAVILFAVANRGRVSPEPAKEGEVEVS